MADAEPDRKVTIYDIAQRAETSASTVGAVMNGTWKARRISESRAEAIRALADEMGYAPNMQAVALRRERSRILGMIVPRYDHRYFAAIAEAFESMARDRGLFPMIACTRRDPELEAATVRHMLAYRAERIICCGATDPDGVAQICARRGVGTLNLDLPGRRATSIISDNHAGALALTREMIDRTGASEILFVGGRAGDHATRERLRGFCDACTAAGLTVPAAHLLTCGYAASKAEAALAAAFPHGHGLPSAIFVNSNESLEGVFRWFRRSMGGVPSGITLGCFDWDPFATAIAPGTLMVRQDVPAMMAHLFALIDEEEASATDVIEVPPIILRPGED